MLLDFCQVYIAPFYNLVYAEQRKYYLTYTHSTLNTVTNKMRDNYYGDQLSAIMMRIRS